MLGYMYMCVCIHNSLQRKRDYGYIIKSSLTCFYFYNILNCFLALSGQLWGEGTKQLPSVRMPLLPSGQQAQTQSHSLVCVPASDLPPVSAVSFKMLWQIHRFSVSSTFHTRWPQTLAILWTEEAHKGDTCKEVPRERYQFICLALCGETTNQILNHTVCVCVCLPRSLNQRGCTWALTKWGQPLDTGVHSLLVGGTGSQYFSRFQDVPYMEGILYFLLNHLF